VDAEDEIVKAVRPDFPGEIGERTLVGVVVVDASAVAGFRICVDQLAAIVVDAEKIERGFAKFHVAGFDAHHFERSFTEEGFGVFALERGMNEPDIAEGVGAVGSLFVGVAGSGGLAIAMLKAVPT